MSDQKLFYFSKNGEQIGPMSTDEAVRRIGEGEFSLADYYYDEASEDWVMLMQNQSFKFAFDRAKSKKPPAPPKFSQPDNAVEWFVLKGENKFGPFTFNDMVRMLQLKKVFEFDYAWNRNMENWMRVAEIEDFSPDKIRGLVAVDLKDQDADKEIFFRRRHMRVEYGASLIIHDNKKVWKGESMEISSGGAGVVMHNSTLKPGSEIFLHFKPGDGVPPFNAVCEIVSKAFVKEVTTDKSPIRYGVRFISMSDDAHLSVKDFIKKAA